LTVGLETLVVQIGCVHLRWSLIGILLYGLREYHVDVPTSYYEQLVSHKAWGNFLIVSFVAVCAVMYMLYCLVVIAERRVGWHGICFFLEDFVAR